jgi:hypothetical protein
MFTFIGTFLGTCEAERARMELSERAVSLWSYLNRPDVLQSFLNPMYDPNNRVIWPSVAPMSLVRSCLDGYLVHVKRNVVISTDRCMCSKTWLIQNVML